MNAAPNGIEAATVPPVPTRLHARNKYLGLVDSALQQAIAYRVMALTSIVANMLWVVILFYLWRAAFAEQGTIEGFTWPQMQTYILLAYGINAMVGFSSASKMMQAIRQGTIVIDMIRPLNYLGTQLASTIGLAIVEGAISFALTLGVGALFLDLQPPASPAHALLFVVSVALGFLTKFLFIFSVSLLVFWTTSSVGLNWAQTALVNVLAGVLIPIQFLPGWLATVAAWLPLRGIVSTPVGVYLGQQEGMRLWLVLGLQLAWVVALWCFADWAWKRAFRAVEIQGG